MVDTGGGGRDLTTGGARHSRPDRQRRRADARTRRGAFPVRGEPFHLQARRLGAPSARPAAGLHQTQRARLRRAHGSGRRHRRRQLGRRRGGRPRQGMPPAHLAGTRPLGTRDRSRRARRRDRRTPEDSPWLCHSAGDQSRQTTPLAADSRPPASPRRGRYLAPAGRRGPAGLPRRPDPRRPSGAGDDRRDRPGHRPPTDRRRDTQRTRCVHVGRPRHHRHDPDLRPVGARPPPRHAGQGPRRNRRHR